MCIGFKVDISGFNKAMDEARDRSRRARTKARMIEDLVLEAEQIHYLQTNGELTRTIFPLLLLNRALHYLI